MKILIRFLFLNFLLWLVGSFIAWDTDVENWWMIQNAGGRILLLILEVIFLSAAIDED